MAIPDHSFPPLPRPRRAPARGTVAIVVGIAMALAASVAALPAGAQTAPDPVAGADAQVTQLRQQADALSGRYFEALGVLADVNRRIDDMEQRIPTLQAETERLRLIAQARAVAAYKRSGADLGSIVSASGPVRAARRAQWLDRLNQRDNAAADDLRTASARLADQRVQLRSAKDAADAALDQVKAQGAQIDALLTSAESRRQAVVAAATAPVVATATSDSAGSGPTPPSAASNASGPTAPPAAPPTALPTTTTTTAPPNTPPPAPPSYSPTPGVSPHHNDPFLVCTRTRESGGNYAAYNPAGPYMGAYQFLQSTWNSAANHAGMPGLIGVPPNQASQYDQDEVAWALYQWQGPGTRHRSTTRTRSRGRSTSGRARAHGAACAPAPDGSPSPLPELVGVGVGTDDRGDPRRAPDRAHDARAVDLRRPFAEPVPVVPRIGLQVIQLQQPVRRVGIPRYERRRVTE
jgi:hypothetical protein